MAPDKEMKNIGIRPGEKLHEIMCPSDDSHLTIEYDDYFVISPSIVFYSRPNDFTSNAIGEKGVTVKQGFEYSSGNNPAFLSEKEILEYNRLP
jgi:UDP-N-acetylglucosamine 4,6-dehydratase